MLKWIAGIGAIAAPAYLGGIWMWRTMPGSSYKGALPPLTAVEARMRDELRTDVAVLAGTIVLGLVPARHDSGQSSLISATAGGLLILRTVRLLHFVVWLILQA